jgi:hypothetical protein
MLRKHKKKTSKPKLADSITYPEDGYSTFLRIVDKATNYATSYSYSRRRNEYQESSWG